MFNARINILAAFALLFGIVFATGCGKPEEKLVGTWQVDVDSMINEDENIKKLEGEAKTQAIEMAKKMAGSMTFEFTKDGKINMAFGEMKQEGTYTVKGTDGNTVTLSTKTKRGDKEKEEEIKVIVDGDKIKMTGPDGKTMALVRK